MIKNTEFGSALIESEGGRVLLPALTLCGRSEGGHVCVHPPRPVWERGELTKAELTAWSCLVAATGQAMLDALPQLAGGCVNYWEAGNWALHDQMPPEGPKAVRVHRRVHLHVFGRSRFASDPAWRWGEAPRFPEATAAADWAARFEPLNTEECAVLSAHIERVLRVKYPVAI
jgi:hypothetical protein